MWTDLFPAAELAAGEVKALEFGGSDLLLFRTHSNALRAVDAYCPHQHNYMPSGRVPGSPLSSLLQGEQLVCPFHGWRFDGDGRCTGLPKPQRVPARIAAGKRIMRSWKIRERDGVIQIGREQRSSCIQMANRS